MGNLKSRNRCCSQDKLILRKKSGLFYDGLFPFQQTIKKMLNIPVDDTIASIVRFIGYPNEIEFSCDITFSNNKRMPTIGKFAIASTRTYYEFPIKLSFRNRSKLLIEFQPNDNSTDIKKVSLYIKRCYYYFF